jgi:hypothetical protein
VSIVNVLLIRWAGGFVELADSASVAANGRREGLLDAGNLSDVDAIVQLAEQNFQITATPTSSIVAKIDDVDPASGWAAYGDFAIGDAVTTPTRAGGTQSVRCVGLTVSEDGDGYLDVSAEFETVRDLAEERVRRWLSRTENGTLDGRSPTPVVSVSSPSIVESGVVSPQDVPVSTDGQYAPEAGDLSAGRTSPVAGFFYRVTVLADAAGTGATTVDVLVNGTAVCEVTIAANAVSALYDLDYAELVKVARTDIFSVEVTAAGGHTGLSWQMFIVPLES